MLRNKLAENWKHSVFLGCQKLGFPNLGSRADIENPAFQNSCSNPNWYWKPEKKIHFKPEKGHFLVYFNRASYSFKMNHSSLVVFYDVRKPESRKQIRQHLQKWKRLRRSCFVFLFLFLLLLYTWHFFFQKCKQR